MGFTHESCFLLPSIAILLFTSPFLLSLWEVRDLAREASGLIQHRHRSWLGWGLGDVDRDSGSDVQLSLGVAAWGGRQCRLDSGAMCMYSCSADSKIVSLWPFHNWQCRAMYCIASALSAPRHLTRFTLLTRHQTTSTPPRPPLLSKHSETRLPRPISFSLQHCEIPRVIGPPPRSYSTLLAPALGGVPQRSSSTSIRPWALCSPSMNARPPSAAC